MRVENLKLGQKGERVERLQFSHVDSAGSILVSSGGVLRLKELSQCRGLKELNMSLQGSEIMPSVLKVDGKTVIEVLQEHSLISDPILMQLLSRSNFHINWYFVNSDSGSDHSNGTPDLTLLNPALGMLVNRSAFEQLPEVDKAGVLLHESLRILFASLNLDVSSHEIEDMTCRSLAGGTFEARRYPVLNEYLKVMKAFNQNQNAQTPHKATPF